jgi:C4-type Zn-finger protein
MEKRDSFSLKFPSSKVRNEHDLYTIEIIVSSFECEECGFKNNEV